MKKCLLIALAATLTACSKHEVAVLRPSVDLTPIETRLSLLEANDKLQDQRLTMLESRQSVTESNLIDFQNNVSIYINQNEAAISALKAQDQAFALALAELQARLDSMNSGDIAAIKTQINQLFQRVQNTESSLSSLISRLSQIEIRVASNEQLTQSINGQVTSLARQVLELSSKLDKLDQDTLTRVNDLSAKIIALDQREARDYADLLSQISSLSARVTVLQANSVSLVVNPCNASESFQVIGSRVYSVQNTFSGVQVSKVDLESIKSIKSLTCSGLGVDLLGVNICLGAKLEPIDLTRVISQTVNLNLLTDSFYGPMTNGTYTEGACQFKVNGSSVTKL